MNLPAHVAGVAGLFWVRAVDGVGWDALLLQKCHSLVQFFAMAVSPQDDAMAVRLQHFQRLNGEGHGLADGWISVFHHGAVKIDCNEQALFHHPRG